VKKILKNDIKISNADLLVKGYVLGFLYCAAVSIFAFGMSQLFDWNNYILMGIMIFILAVWASIMWD
jgi:hypothetical protein